MANSYLTWQNSTATNSTKFTMSGWVKRGNLNSSSYNCIMSCRQTSSSNAMGLWFGEDKVFFNFGTSASASTTGFDTSAKVRDVNGWYHIVVAGDASQSGTDKLKVWINGTQQTSFVTDNRSSFATLEYDFGNTSYPIQVGRKHDDTFFWDGYMSHVAFVDGQALAPTVFGETDSTSGIWKFKSPAGVTWGNNGFWLKFENSGALGTDSSGNSNTFTVNGNGRQAVDTPSNVYATLNSLIPSTNIAFSNGNNTVTGSQADNYSQSTISTLGVSSGKWYCEAKYTTANSNANPNVGIATLENFRYDVNNTGSSGFANVRFDGQVYVDGSSGTATYWGSNPVAGDIIMFALDMDNGKFYLGKNGTWENSGDPTSGSTGTGSITSSRSGTQAFNVRYLASVFDFNFGNGYFGTTAVSSAGTNASNNGIFEYDVPTGYTALSTKGLNL